MYKVLLFLWLLVFLSPSFIRHDGETRRYWIVWNVGQGQWSTLAEADSCRHFDMGGEKNPVLRVARLCRGRTNIISLSHWDLDHVGFLARAKKYLNHACVETAPLGTSSARKMKMVASYSRCSGAGPGSDGVRELTRFTGTDLRQKTNDLSHVFEVRGEMLIPGDSTSRQEKIWSYAGDLSRVRYLLLGHHGSRTSTSAELLSRLRGLKTAVASARFAKYGHPHQEVVQRLARVGVPLLKTEDWGNIWFEIGPPHSSP